MLLVGGQHLVAGLQVQRGEHAHDALARARRQRDVAGRGAEQLGVGRAQAPARVAQGVEVGRATTLGARLVDHRADGRAGRGGNRSARPGVEVGRPLQDGKRGAQHGRLHRAPG
jgi:hypothetical protein